MRSMSAPSDEAAPTAQVWHYDGRSAIRHRATLIADGETFRLEAPGLAAAPERFDALTALDQGYGLRGQPGWRLSFVDPPPPAIAERLPLSGRYGGPIDRFGLWRSAAVLAVIAAVVVIGLLQLPTLVAQLVPTSLERRLGDLMVGDFGNRFCSTPAGDAALDKLAATIAPELPDTQVNIANLPVVNAVTLPGGRIILFNGLVQRAQSPDEIAGVVGHELGHVAHRDVVASLLRQLGLSVLLGGLDGRVSGYTNALLSTAYSRDAESRADGYAIEAMLRANVSPAPTAAFFARLSKSEIKDKRAAQLISYVSSHPMASDRAQKFATAARTHGPYRPALDAADWAALRGICAGKPVEPLIQLKF